ncbi:hypothetical protein [Thalassotalea ganghwensis]
MINRKLLKSFLDFSQQQKPAPSFVLIYLTTWLVWHNQLFSAFFLTPGNGIERLMAAYHSIENNQYVLVLFLTTLFLTIRLGYNYIVYKSHQVVMSVDEDELMIRGDQLAKENEDVKALMQTLERTKAKLEKVKLSEEQAQQEKKEAIAKMLNYQVQLEEAQADLAILQASIQDENTKA